MWFCIVPLKYARSFLKQTEYKPLYTFQHSKCPKTHLKSSAIPCFYDILPCSHVKVHFTRTCISVKTSTYRGVSSFSNLLQVQAGCPPTRDSQRYWSFLILDHQLFCISTIKQTRQAKLLEHRKSQSQSDFAEEPPTVRQATQLIEDSLEVASLVPFM